MPNIYFFIQILNRSNDDYILILFYFVLGIIITIVTIFYSNNKSSDNINRVHLSEDAGERTLGRILQKLPPEEYKVINDVTLILDGVAHQIDHIIISSHGIFVIETKNYAGVVSGGDKDYYWYQHLKHKKYKIRNPIHQNNMHIIVLSKMLKLSYDKFISIICFSNRTILNVHSNKIVIHMEDILPIVAQFSVINKNIDVEKVFNFINSHNIDDKEIKLLHRNYVSNKINKAEIKINNMICPKCGHKLVKKNGKYGPFTGCSNYPRCTFTKK